MTNQEIATDMKVPIENVVEAKRLMKLYRQRRQGKVAELRQALDAYDDKYTNLLNYDLEHKLLQILDRLLEGFGVESFELQTDLGKVYCSYVNTGDSYSLTVVSCKDLDILEFMSYADLIEQHEIDETEDADDGQTEEEEEEGEEGEEEEDE